MPSKRTTPLAAAAIVVLCGILGCGSGGPRTYPVNGKVELTGGEARQLAGGHVELALESDTTVRASGEIGPDGRFSVQTLHEGNIRSGAIEGTYRVRLIAAEEDAEGRRIRKVPFAAKFRRFETSGLSVNVPASGEVTLTISPR